MASTEANEISKDIIEGCVAGNRKHQKIVYENLYQTMYAICLRYSNSSDEAKDLLQDGFMKLFKKVKKYNVDAPFTIWVKRLFINHCIDYVRSAYKKYVYYFDEVYSDDSVDPFEEEDHTEEISKSDVFEAMNKIRADYRLILNLFAIENLSHAEIAEKLNIQEASSRSKLSRARVALKKELNRE
ncbi:MAG: RNA polymerase sigma factor (sigma-70 family) [Bacteroidia bacterium]|jgi:RNA polymerase sigma factor (sigma-70 family)